MIMAGENTWDVYNFLREEDKMNADTLHMHRC